MLQVTGCTSLNINYWKLLVVVVCSRGSIKFQWQKNVIIELIHCKVKVFLVLIVVIIIVVYDEGIMKVGKLGVNHGHEMQSTRSTWQWELIRAQVQFIILLWPFPTPPLLNIIISVVRVVLIMIQTLSWTNQLSAELATEK